MTYMLDLLQLLVLSVTTVHGLGGKLNRSVVESSHISLYLLANEDAEKTHKGRHKANSTW